MEKELHSFQHKWVKDWNIFVRKDGNSRAIKIHSEKVLEKLLSEQPEFVPKKRSFTENRNRYGGAVQSYRTYSTVANSDAPQEWPNLAYQPGPGHFDCHTGVLLTGQLPKPSYSSGSFSHARSFNSRKY